MWTEAMSAPECVARQLAQDEALYARLAARLRGRTPPALLTLARGSSDHAAQYLAYLVMARLGRLVTSLPMSLLTLYGSQVAGPGIASLAFSQSGQSPDLVEPTRALRQAGACTACFVNSVDSPLAEATEHVLPLHAGTERSVAATKSYLAQLVAGARLVAACQEGGSLGVALGSLPQALERAAALRWDAAVARLRDAEQLLVIGRGLGLAVAQEAALKFKETCGIQAEAFSGAEVQHGPMALVGPGYPLLVLAPRGRAQPGLLALAAQMRARGADVLLAVPEAQCPDAAELGVVVLPLAATAHEDLDPIAVAQSFYPMVESLARERGLDPDSPRHLAKVTRTH
jgi:glucosamine--fructose-6-phosphate aminotransferase (isomerizing)